MRAAMTSPEVVVDGESPTSTRAPIRPLGATSCALLSRPGTSGALMFFHSGGQVTGSRTGYDHVGRLLAEHSGHRDHQFAAVTARRAAERATAARVQAATMANRRRPRTWADGRHTELVIRRLSAPPRYDPRGHLGAAPAAALATWFLVSHVIPTCGRSKKFTETDAPHR